jgi:hypothetical protein
LITIVALDIVIRHGARHTNRIQNRMDCVSSTFGCLCCTC